MAEDNIQSASSSDDAIEIEFKPILLEKYIDELRSDLEKVFTKVDVDELFKDIDKPISKAKEDIKELTESNISNVEKIKKQVKIVRELRDVLEKAKILDDSGTISKHSELIYNEALSQEVKLNKQLLEIEKKRKTLQTQKNKLKRGTEFLNIVGRAIAGDGKDLPLDIQRQIEKLRISSYKKQFENVKENSKDYEELAENIGKSQKELERLNKEIEKQKELVKKGEYDKEINFLNIIGETMTKDEKLKIDKKIQEYELKKLKIDLGNGKEGTKEYNELAESITNVQNKINKLNKDISDSKKVGPIEKLFNTFKRVGFYRIARRFFSYIEQGFGDSLRSLTLFDNGFNNTMSSITSSFSIISSSLVAMLVPILETIEPIIKSISSFVAEIANGFNKASANAKGLSDYLKINTEYLKDFNQEQNNSLFSFDKFNALQNNDPLSGIYSEGDINDASKKTEEIGESLFSMFNAVVEVVKNLWEIVKPISIAFFNIVNPVLKITNVIIKILKPVLIIITKSIKNIINAIMSLVEILGSFLNLFIFDFKAFINDFIGGFKKFFKALYDSIALLFNMITLGIFSKGNSKIKMFAKGGLPNKGDLFIANERGPEVVTSFSGGQSGVLNVSQFKQAMVEALYECSDLFDRGDITVVAPIDGADVARSKRFIDEFNRRNSGIKIL